MIGIFPDRVNILFIKFELSMLSDRLPGARVGVRKSWVPGPRPGIIQDRPNYDTPSLLSRALDMEKLCVLISREQVIRAGRLFELKSTVIGLWLGVIYIHPLKFQFYPISLKTKIGNDIVQSFMQ